MASLSTIRHVLHDKLLFIVFAMSLFMLLGVFSFTALISISEFLILLFWLLLLPLGQFKQQLYISFSSRIVQLGLLLLLLMLVQSFFTPASTSLALDQVGHYRELLLLPLLFYILNRPSWKKRVYYAFLAGMIVILIHSYLQFFGWVQNPLTGLQENTSKLGRIAGAIMLAFTCFAFLEEAIKNKHRTLIFGLWLGLFFIGSFALVALYNGRTGLLIYFILAAIWTSRLFGIKSLIGLIMIAPIIAISLYQTSSLFKERIDETHGQFQQIINNEVPEDNLKRQGFYAKTLPLLKEHSLWGGGTGSYKHEMAERQYDIHNPHNEYLLILFENGVLGLLLLLGFFYYCWKQANQLDEHQRWLLRALVISFAVGSLFNSLLLDNREAHWYILLLVALMPSISSSHQDNPS